MAASDSSHDDRRAADTLARIAKARAGIRDGDPADLMIPILIVDAATDNGVILYANQLMHTLAMWPQGQLRGQPLDVLIPRVSHAAHHHFRAGFMLHPQTRPMGLARKVVLMQGNGDTTRVWVSLGIVDESTIMCFVFPQLAPDAEALMTRVDYDTDERRLPADRHPVGVSDPVDGGVMAP